MIILFGAFIFILFILLSIVWLAYEMAHAENENSDDNIPPPNILGTYNDETIHH